MSSLDTLAQDHADGVLPDTLADTVDELVTVAVVEQTVKDRKTALREHLTVQALDIEKATGSAFTSRLDNGTTAGLTVPKPTARIVDGDAFFDDLEVHAPGVMLRRESTPAISSANAERLRLRLDNVLAHGDEYVPALLDTLNALTLPVEERHVSEDVLTDLVEDRVAVLSDEAMYWIDGGERIAGVDVTTAKRALQVRPSKQAKEARLNELTAAAIDARRS